MNTRTSIQPRDGSIIESCSAQANTKAKASNLIQSTVFSRRIGGCISQWLCTRWWGSSDEPAQLQAECLYRPQPTRPLLQVQPYPSNSLDCKACREWNVNCNHSWPQCEHCYQQQILCFYVGPRQNAMRKARQSEISSQREYAPDRANKPRPSR